ncbi:MAG: hypothetical protein CMD05_04560, partial [Flavobacteriales bacterium]|nr:hypothetical protein [Flavobacteriales bacterium]
MNRILLFSLLICHSSSYAQTFVSTTPENKNIILEEFTGISCTFCPDGHKIGQQLHDNNPNDVFLINIHTGGYASPQGPGTDFNTSFGSAISNQSGTCGYPAGTVNRRDFTAQGWNQTSPGPPPCNATTAMSRGEWSAAVQSMLAEPSPVNVGIQATVDLGSNTLTVDVEVYYTGTQTVSSNKLNVAIVQNNILGPQTGGSTYNPTAIDPATGFYTHNHMLRHMLTGQWGESISNISQGTLYSNSYTWNIPDQISGYPLSPRIDPTQLAVIAYVSEGNQEILSGTEVYPTISSSTTNDAFFVSSSATDIECDPVTNLEVTLRNHGSVSLTSCDIEYEINGGNMQTYNWTGNLGTGAQELVSIPNISTNASLTNTVSVSLVNPNGSIDDNTNNNDGTSTFAGLKQAAVGTATITIVTDNYGNETTWELRKNGATILSGGPYAASTPNITHNESANLDPDECYSFIMKDSYGDGLLAPGSFIIRDASGNPIAYGNSFTFENKTNFTTSIPSSVNDN